MNLRSRFRPLAALALGVFALAFAGRPAGAQDDGGYSYIRTLEGSATVILDGSDTREPAEINQPILPGDRLVVNRGSRVELVLSDRSLVHLDGSTEVAFDELAFSPADSDFSYEDDGGRYGSPSDRRNDEDRRSTVRASTLRLIDGEARIVTDDFPRGYEAPAVDVGNGTVYLGEHGSFRLITDQGDWSEVTVREGSAEVETGRGSQIVREGQTATLDGVTRARISFRPALGRDGLERWAEALLDQGDSYRDRYVDDDLRYASVPLSRYGTWTTIDRRPVWRPRVSSSWRPYSLGRWRTGPGGAIWISSEPWGWVPYHYGTWDYFPGYGWGWVPGRVFAPAWVYWYWGPSYVGWCPVGYYTRYYGGYGFRGGLYGWAHGSSNFFAEWNFVPFGSFRDHDLGRRIRRGRDLRIDLGRGIVTTDTRPLGRERWERWSDPTRAIEILRRGRPELPDVSDFVARKRDLPPTVRREIAVERERPGDRRAGTPLAPGTLGGGADGAAPGARTADLPRGRTRWNTGGGAVEGQPAPNGGEVDRGRGNERSGLDTRSQPRDDGRSGLDTRETGRETSRETGRETDRDGGRSGLDTRDTGRERVDSNRRTGGDTPANDSPSTERRRSEPSARPSGEDSSPPSGEPVPVERRRPIYERPDDSNGRGSGSNTRDAEPEPVRERPIVRERPNDSPPPSDPPPSYRREEPAPRRDEPSASRREAPSSPPPQEAKPRENPSPDSSSDSSSNRSSGRRQNRERPPSNDEGDAGSPPPRR